MVSKNIKSPLLSKYLSAYKKDPRSRVFAPLAELYRELGEVEKALDILKNGIKLHPTYNMGYLGMAKCYFDLGDYNLSYTTLRPLVALTRDNIHIQKLFAKSCLELGYKEEALETYKFLLFLNPKDVESAENVKVIEANLDNICVLEEESEIGPNDFNDSPIDNEELDIDDWIQVSFSDKEVENENVDEENWSVSNPSEEISVIPTNDSSKETPVITHTLVDLYCAQGHIDKGIEILKKILELNPEDQRTQQKLTETQKLLSSIEKTENLEEAVKDDHSNLMDFFDQEIGNKIRVEEDGKIVNDVHALAEKFLEKIKEKAYIYKTS